MISNKLYDFMKMLCSVYLPALSVFYAAIAKIWGLPFPVEICGTLAAAAVFIGAVIKKSSDNYWNEIEEKNDENESGTF